MEKPNPKSPKNSTNPKSPSADHENSPPPTNPTDEGKIVLKTPEEVLAELSAGDENLYSGGGVAQGGSSVAFAMTAAGGSVAVVIGGGVGVGGGVNEVKKRKNTQLKDPPSGTPTCPECQREFATWKAAFGHMRKHPERPHRGFFPPPAFDSEEEETSQTNNTVAPIDDQGDIGGVDMKVQSLVQRIIFNLSQQQQKGEAGPSNASQGQQARAAAREAEDDDGGKKFDFDLNQPPPPEDDEDMA